MSVKTMYLDALESLICSRAVCITKYKLYHKDKFNKFLFYHIAKLSIHVY